MLQRYLFCGARQIEENLIISMEAHTETSFFIASLIGLSVFKLIKCSQERRRCHFSYEILANETNPFGSSL